MSLVGPRPEDPHYVALYTPAQRAILDVRPGITSLASLRYRNEEAMLAGPEWETHYVQEILPVKLALDLDYAQRATPWRDLLIILRTILSH
jgi:lipopolysaccharide/colanic/teichoic acid biosynthesis glycosyltransferase